ncbi:MAG: Bax inhibitor-1/YccA family protein [Desulfovibrio sp.]|nr:Bax inhibitor-1/YccA family protein [Desulfovibrio sp.]
MNQTPFAYSRNHTGSLAASKTLTAVFMRGVYQWMCLGLLATAGMTWFTLNSQAMLNLLVTPEGGLSMLYWGAVIAEVGLVLVLSVRIAKLSAFSASAMFLTYSLLNGVTLSLLVAMYTQASVMRTFLVCAGMFGAMSVYGMVTKRDLTGMGNFLIMGLIGILLASVVNIFLVSTTMHYVISYLGVLIFTGLTAYDTQKLKEMGATMPLDDATAVRRGTILGALTLYLDFINLFIMLLRIMGDRR